MKPRLPSRLRKLDPMRLVDKISDRVDGVAQLAAARRGAAILASAPRPPAGLTPHEVVHTQDKLALRYYAAARRVPGRLPVVLVPSLINKAWILDLEPGRSLVEALSDAGWDTYLVDWGTPGAEDAEEDVAYIVLDLLQRAIDRACRHAGAKQAHILGYCMGGTLSLLHAALRPERVASLVALAAPVKFSEGGRFKDLADAVDVERAITPDGLLPVEVMKPAFQLLDPMGNWTKLIALDRAARDPRTLARSLVRERWLEENVPLPGSFARDFLKNAYQEDRLLAGTWTVAGETVDLSSITCPVLVAICDNDFITPPAAALPLADAVGGPVRTERLDCGHIGVVVGGFGPKVFYPLLDAWFTDPGAATSN